MRRLDSLKTYIQLGSKNLSLLSNDGVKTEIAVTTTEYTF